MKLSKALLLLCLFSTVPTFAEEADPAMLQAIVEAQKALTDPEAREKAANTPEAKSSVEAVKALGGNAENAEAIFQLSADVFAEFAKQTQGDPAKMEELLQKAKSNPSEFANKFSPALKAKLSEIAKKIPEPPKKSLP